LTSLDSTSDIRGWYLGVTFLKTFRVDLLVMMDIQIILGLGVVGPIEYLGSAIQISDTANEKLGSSHTSRGDAQFGRAGGRRVVHIVGDRGHRYAFAGKPKVKAPDVK
ncbi:hypothetical protein HAX54_046617, partial [Datura stramonium]|nr:hypothetical protein [Datura stramonium]